jgi:hypothetical protein
MRADVLALVQLLSNNAADAALINSFYDEMVIELARQQWLTNASLLTFTLGSTTVNLPGNAVEILDIIYDNTVLTELSLSDLKMIFGENWRSRKGYTRAYTLEAESKKTIEVCPAPLEAASAVIPVHGLPTGWDYPTYNGVIINSETRNDVPVYLELPLALMIIEREYMRESDHQDLAFAIAAGGLANILLEMMK